MLTTSREYIKHQSGIYNPIGSTSVIYPISFLSSVVPACYKYIYTIANCHIKVTDRCYICDIHLGTGRYGLSERVQSSCKFKRIGDELFANGKGA